MTRSDYKKLLPLRVRLWPQDMQDIWIKRMYVFVHNVPLTAAQVLEHVVKETFGYTIVATVNIMEPNAKTPTQVRCVVLPSGATVAITGTSNGRRFLRLDYIHTLVAEAQDALNNLTALRDQLNKTYDSMIP